MVVGAAELVSAPWKNTPGLGLSVVEVDEVVEAALVLGMISSVVLSSMSSVTVS